MNLREGRSLEALATVYRLFSAAFREPMPDPNAPRALQELFKDFAQEVSLQAPPDPPGNIGAEFRGIFGHNLSPDCPPYETQYGKNDVFRQTNALADLHGFYRAFGVGMTDGDRRPDHLPVELEFVSLLCLKEALAMKQSSGDKVFVCRDARTKFLERHLARWIPALAQAVNKKAPNTYYAGLLASLVVFVTWDARTLGVDSGKAKLKEPRRDEPEDPCLSCFGGIA